MGAKSLQSIHARITMEIGDARAGGQNSAIGGDFEVIECREMGVCPFCAQFPLAGAPPRSMMSDTAFLHGLRQLTQISLPPCWPQGREKAKESAQLDARPLNLWAIASQRRLEQNRRELERRTNVGRGEVVADEKQWTIIFDCHVIGEAIAIVE